MCQSFEQQAYEHEDAWNEGALGEADEFRVAFLAKMIPEGARSLLDVGCGNGLFLNYLLDTSPNRFSRLCGLDRSPTALAHVRTEKHLGSADSMSFANQVFDIVSSLEVIEHLPLNIYGKALDELCRVARRWVLICVPLGERLEDAMVSCPSCRCRFNPYYHMRSFDAPAMRALLDRRSFVCREMRPVYPVKMLPFGLSRVSHLARQIRETPFPWRGVCPMCGFSTPDASRPRTIPQTPPSRIQRVMDLARIATGHRWIAALYERS